MNLRGKLCSDCDKIWKEEMRLDSAKRYGKVPKSTYPISSKEKELINSLADIEFEDL